MQFVWRGDEDTDGLPGGRPRASAAASSRLIECRAGAGAQLRLAGATDWLSGTPPRPGKDLRTAHRTKAAHRTPFPLFPFLSVMGRRVSVPS